MTLSNRQITLNDTDIHIFSGSKNSFLFNPTNASSILVSNEIATKISQHNIDNNISEKLLHRKFLDNSIKSDEEKREITPVTFMIDFTKACQNRCNYCFRELNQHKFISYTTLTLILNYIIDYCHQNSIENIALQPWGGEPLLAWDKIKFMQNHLLSHNIKPQINIETNAIAINNTIAKELYNHEIAISVSIDGYKEIHNHNRPMINGKGSYDHTISGFYKLQDAGYGNKIGIVGVITKKSLQHISQIIDFYAETLKIHRVKMNIIRESANLKDADIALTDNDIINFCNTLCDNIIRINQAGYPFGESGIIERLHNLLDLKPTSLCCSRGCQGRNRIFSFDMNGNIYPCDMVDSPDFSIGNINDNISFSNLTRNSKNKFYQHSTMSNNCNNCIHKFFCKGGCPAMALFRGSTIDGAECLRNKQLYPRLIEIIVENPDLISSITNGEINII